MRALKEYASELGIFLDDAQLELFRLYEEQLLLWNEKINLTSITLHEEILVKHFLDSLLLLAAAPPEGGTRLLDVGTGAGFPGVPLKIARPDLELTLLDSLRKRVVFLEGLSAFLGLRYTVLHGRAEEKGHDSALRERFSLVSARAVAALPVLCEYCLPFLELGGIFAALKGPRALEEAQQAQSSIRALGGSLLEIKEYTLPDGSCRAIVLVKKISHTLPKYPRTPAKMTKAPL